MISSKTFDPFNHGMSEVKYKNISRQFSDQLSKIVTQGWKISKISKISEHDVGPKVNSNNFKIETPTTTLLLKRSHLNDVTKLSLINENIFYLGSQRVPVPRIRLTKTGQSLFVIEGNVYCLYDFIFGEHYDGSVEELVSAAKEVANLINALEKIPNRSAIKKSSRFLYHDPDLLRETINISISANQHDAFENLIRKNSQDILKVSENVVQNIHDLDRLPKQVVHGDLHPHNMMFDPITKNLLAFLDFDTLEYGLRIRSVGHAMHRLSRTYGLLTQRKMEVGSDIRDRLGIFLNTYLKFSELEDDEKRLLGIVVQDRELNGITIILSNHYLKNNFEWDFDLAKRIRTLAEAVAFL